MLVRLRKQRERSAFIEAIRVHVIEAIRWQVFGGAAFPGSTQCHEDERGHIRYGLLRTDSVFHIEDRQLAASTRLDMDVHLMHPLGGDPKVALGQATTLRTIASTVARKIEAELMRACNSE